jgi:hypothetical protein
MYTWQTGCSTDTRVKEHHWHICLEYSDKSAMVASSSKKVESSSPNPGTWTINTRKATEIKPHPNMIQGWLFVLVIHRKL